VQPSTVGAVWSPSLGMWALVAVVLTAAELVDPLPGSTRGPRFGDAPWFLLYLTIAPLIGAAADRTVDGVDRLPFAPLRTLPFGIRIAASLVVFDLVAYGLHRLMHTTAWWRLHRTHHVSAGLSWWTAFRAHPLSALATHAIPVTVLAVLGASADATAVAVAVVFAVTLLGHADVWVPPALEWVVATPAYHRRHHEVDHAHHNLVLLFPLIDLAFGTCVMSPGTPARRAPRTQRSPHRSSAGTATTVAAGGG
jgi:sterol desaturase/sphingolipid hydroxylase (fatty acid hydroxylase superfamily)